METRRQQIERETAFLRAFQRQADAIAQLIISSDLPAVDLALHIDRLRREVERWYPQKVELFDLIYVSRFRRLWRQWRDEDGCDF